MPNQVREEVFFNTTGWSDAMAAVGAVVNQQISIAADVNFKAYYLMASCRQGAAGAEVITINTFAGTVQINDSQIGKNLFNIAIPFQAINGMGADVFNLAPPRIFASNTVIIFSTISNVATRTQVAYTLAGAKLYNV